MFVVYINLSGRHAFVSSVSILISFSYTSLLQLRRTSFPFHSQTEADLSIHTIPLCGIGWRAANASINLRVTHDCQLTTSHRFHTLSGRALRMPANCTMIILIVRIRSLLRHRSAHWLNKRRSKVRVVSRGLKMGAMFSLFRKVRH